MKKLLKLLIFFFLPILCNAQDKPITIPKLKEFIGLNQSKIESILKKKKYYLDEKDVDESGYGHEYYNDKDYNNEIDIFYKNKIAIAAGIETITSKEYEDIIAWLKANKFYLKTKGSIGTERQDLWESDDEEWRFVIDYKTWPDFKPLRFMLYKTS